MSNKQSKIDALISYALSNLFFYRAKSITFNVTNFQYASAVILGADPDQFPQYHGRVVTLSNTINAETVYETAKQLIEQKTHASLSDLCPKLPFDTRENYIGLRYVTNDTLPCPIMVASISKGSSQFYLQLTAQNLEKSLKVLREELDAWNKSMAEKGMLHNISKPLEV